MPDAFLVPTPDLALIVQLIRHLDQATLLYLAATIVARFWHKQMWLVYATMTVASLLLPHG